MSGRRVLHFVTVLGMVLSVLYVGSGAAPAAVDEARAEHERIVAFWTPERVAQAIPRDFVFEPGLGFRPAAKPDKPGKPGGGGGGGNGDVVLGASWRNGGAVATTTGKVLFQMGASYYVCSASVVRDTNSQKSLVLTAAHCAYDEANGAFATNWMFVPDYDGQPAPLTTDGSFCSGTVYGCWTAEKLYVHSGYTSAGGFNTDATLHDYAFAVMGNGGQANSLVETLGVQDVMFAEVAEGDTVYAFGYPAAQKYKGNDLVYCKGPSERDPYNSNLTYRLGCDMTGGSSGGPNFAGFDENTGTGTLMSVNSYGYSGVKAMHGPIFDSKTAAVYTAANSASGNTIVP